MKQYESYKCSKCGNTVEVQSVGGGELQCCGEKMEMITENLTAVNLMKAFAGESMARNKYEYYAKVAQKEGYRDIAEHFQRAANNEKKHANLELRAYNEMIKGKELGDTVENLIDAIAGESYENETMYPDFSKIAKEEGHNRISKMLELIGKIEIEHENMYKSLLERLQNGKEFESEDDDEEWICEVCGHVHRGKKPPKACPVCKHPQEYFSRQNTKK
ncbi:rubrerythrin family protein [Malaciobacter molluscorum LMG 25693]|uniref:Desulforubrerythrin n=1 Tax=Malaciobacter molluscorum LMG 25693 TaxID=870501 RepID=A0A2G1DEU6_9BACT|nr:ferritin family protein [Malaciobacter molluscorum]AXX92805.1 desulforubrerythrin [Malaciobacter molluscorum LMG 25693]PHO17003.1 rubrerythrin family protein [Malaciobacter molluscorum LMG 25693]